MSRSLKYLDPLDSSQNSLRYTPSKSAKEFQGQVELSAPYRRLDVRYIQQFPDIEVGIALFRTILSVYSGYMNDQIYCK